MGKIAIVQPSDTRRNDRNGLSHYSLSQQKHCTLLKHTTVELIVKDLVKHKQQQHNNIHDNNNTIKQVSSQIVSFFKHPPEG